tara:strand:+ start:362 stop:862 length:501 start_codon:yes stop_codon:yes gene_type:complete
MNLKIPKELKVKCWDFLKKNNLGNRLEANGNKEQQFVGLIGEIMVVNLFGLEYKFSQGFDGGFDFIYKGKKIDVKTMGRTVDPKPYFVNNFIAFQKDFNCDYYIFTSLNKKTNELTICGYLSKEDLLKKSTLYKKGTKRTRTNGTSFILKADTYEIENFNLKKYKI